MDTREITEEEKAAASDRIVAAMMKSHEKRRKSLVRGDHFPAPEHHEDTRKAALTRAYAEMFELSDRFNTETEET